MNYRIILHVGPWKTGSTALQDFFQLNRGLLLSHGIFYPIGVVAENAHHEIPNLVKDSMTRFPWVSNKNELQLDEIVNNYFNEMKLMKISTLLLSSEDFASFNSEDYSKLITSLSLDREIDLEVLYFEFNPEMRLASYVNQLVRQGEFINPSTSEQILLNISQITAEIERVYSVHSKIMHRIDYDSLETPNQIFQNTLALILVSKLDFFQLGWLIPSSKSNPSFPSAKITLLNEFNRSNIGDRPFDYSCPVVFSNSFPRQTERLSKFIQLLEENILRDSALAERDSALAERDSALAERDKLLESNTWKAFESYRKFKAAFKKKGNSSE